MTTYSKTDLAAFASAAQQRAQAQAYSGDTGRGALNNGLAAARFTQFAEQVAALPAGFQTQENPADVLAKFRFGSQLDVTPYVAPKSNTATYLAVAAVVVAVAAYVIGSYYNLI